MAEIRTALSSLVSIATLWLLLWRKELDKMTEGKKERERGGGVEGLRVKLARQNGLERSGLD